MVVGCGGLGSWTALGLAKGGVKEITLVDPDIVEEKNLNTQVYGPEDIGKYKVDALADKIRPYAKVDTYRARIEEVIDELPDFDLALALTDNIKSRVVVERKYKTLHAMVQPTHGMVMMTTKKSKLVNIMRDGEYRGHQDLSMVMMVASVAIREALKYLNEGMSELEGRLMIISPYKFEVINLEGSEA